MARVAIQSFSMACEGSAVTHPADEGPEPWRSHVNACVQVTFRMYSLPRSAPLL